MMSNTTGEETRSLLPIQVQSTWLMIDASHVREVLGLRAFTPIPGATLEIPGVIPWRGRAVTVLDLGALITGLRPLELNETRARTVIVQVGDALLALLVDAAREVQEMASSSLRPPHATDQPLASHEVVLGGTVMPIINLVTAVERVSVRGRRSA
jgi:chemotaxis signal transduction protein